MFNRKIINLFRELKKSYCINFYYKSLGEEKPICPVCGGDIVKIMRVAKYTDIEPVCNRIFSKLLPTKEDKHLVEKILNSGKQQTFCNNNCFYNREIRFESQETDFLSFLLKSEWEEFKPSLNKKQLRTKVVPDKFVLKNVKYSI